MRKEPHRPRPGFGCALFGALLSPLVVAAPTLSTQIPFDVTATPPFSLTSLQQNFDDMSWQTFIALNWPALADGNPNTGVQIGQQDAATVWEGYRESYQIFLPQGQKPQPFRAPAAVPPACEGKGSGRLLQQMGKVPDVLDEFIQPFESGPLVDQSGVYTRNEIVVNQSMFDGIVDRKSVV